MQVNEIFWSIQGEGSRAGISSLFLRLAGCTLQCHYCDTRESWDRGTRMGVGEIVAALDRLREQYPDSQVVITGGEPLEQNLVELVAGLKRRKYFLALETNGIYFQDVEIDWWTLSPKDIGGYYISAGLAEKISEVKLIVNQSLTPEIIEKIRNLRGDFPIFLQPDFFDPERYSKAFALFQESQKLGLKNIRLGMQLHRIFDIK